MKRSNGILFIGDIRMASANSSTRIHSKEHCPYVYKIGQAINIAIRDSLEIYIVGKLFNKCFDVNLLSKAIDLFRDVKPTVIACDLDYKRNGDVNQTSASSILHRTGVINLISSTCLEKITNNHSINLYIPFDCDQIARNIFHSKNIGKNEKLLVVDSRESDQDWSKAGIHGCQLIICNRPGSQTVVVNNNEFGTQVVNLGPLFRSDESQSEIEPSVVKWTEEGGAEEIIIKHDRHVFHEKSHSIANKIISDSEFTKMLVDESNRIKDMKDSKGFLRDQISEIRSDLKISDDAYKIILDLESRTSNPLLHIEGLF